MPPLSKHITSAGLAQIQNNPYLSAIVGCEGIQGCVVTPLRAGTLVFSLNLHHWK